MVSVDKVIDLPGEIWKDFPEFENLYSVSNMGRVKTKPYEYVSLQGHKIVHPEVLAKIQYSPNNPEHDYYAKVWLRVNNQFVVRLIHIVVATVFVPNDDPTTKTQVYHLDGNLNNCRADNLGWRFPQGSSQLFGRYSSEIWKPVVGFEGLYEVSSLGRIRCTERYIIGKDGKPQFKYSKILSQDEKNSKDLHGRGKYKRITLCVNGKLIHKSVHRLVAEAFIPNDDPEHKIEVNHKDGVKNHNWVSNLEWVTPQENKEHAKQYDLTCPPLKIQYGEISTNAKLTNKEAEQMRYEFANGATVKHLAKKYNLGINTATSVVKGKTYRTAGGPIDNGRIVRKGIDSPCSLFNQDQINKIRSEYTGRVGDILTLMRKYNASRQTISRIVHNKRYN